MAKKKTNLVVSGVTNLVEDKRLDEIKDILIKLEKQNTLTNKKLTAIDKKLKSIDGKDLNLDDIWEYQISGVTVGEIIQNTSKKLNDVNDTLEVASEKIRYNKLVSSHLVSIFRRVLLKISSKCLNCLYVSQRILILIFVHILILQVFFYQK